MLSRFFYPGDLGCDQEIELSSEESHHIAKVLRLMERAEVEVINGRGSIAIGSVVSISAKRVVVRINSVQTTEKRPRVHVVFAMTKGAAMDFIVHRCTEVGVASFQPVYSQHSLHVSHFNRERWEKVLVEVCKQCQELHSPVLHTPLDFRAWLQKREKAKRLFICDEAQRESSGLKYERDEEVEVLVGPEGGWSREERELFPEACFLGLGKNRLRAETAALTATILAKKIIGEL